jgi:hypothetical protein
MWGMSPIPAIGFVALVLLPIFFWRLSVGGDERAPLAVASLLSAISALWILRDEVTVQRVGRTLGLAVFFFVIALMTVRPEYSEDVVVQFEERGLVIDSYEKLTTIEEVDPANLEIENSELEMIPYREALERGYEDPVGFDFGDSK